MKKLFLVTSFILALGASLLAQDCATGYCPATITVHHKAGSVSPITADITYEVTRVNVNSTPTYKCFITRNLGATTAPTAATVVSYTSNGWYWQFNRKQGFTIGSTGTFALQPSTSASGWNNAINDPSAWAAANDPCTLLLGVAWRIPLNTEFAYFTGGYATSTLFASGMSTALAPIKLNDAGFVNPSGNGMAYTVGAGYTYYWTSEASGSSTYGDVMYVTNTSSGVQSGNQAIYKSSALPLRCVRTY